MKIHLSNGFRGISPTTGGPSTNGAEKSFAEKIAEELKRLKEVAEALQMSESASEDVPEGQAPNQESRQSEDLSGSEEKRCKEISDPAKALLYNIRAGELFESLKDVVGLT